MSKKKYSIAVGLAGALIAGYMSNLPARSVSSINSFYRAIERRRLAVVMLYRMDKNLRKDDRELYDQVKNAESAFKSLNGVHRYKKADMRFVEANVTKSKLETLPNDLGVTVQKYPIYVLFAGGKSIKSSMGAKAIAQGFLTVEQLRDFIDSNMKDQIEDYLDDKAERRERERSRVYVGFGGGYPWYGYYPYYGGWGYPYYGGFGYGGRVGFGVGFGF